MKYIINGKISSEVADTLYELGNVGVGRASVALGKIAGIALSIGIPKVTPLDQDVNDVIGDDPEKVAIGILMSMEKTLGGAVLFIIDSGFLTLTVSKLTGRTVLGEELVKDAESLSAIGELANIMAASYMNIIGKYTGLRIYLSPVMVGVDMIGALITYPVAQLGITDCSSICVDTSFAVMGANPQKTVGRVIMFPNEASVEQILNALSNTNGR